MVTLINGDVDNNDLYCGQGHCFIIEGRSKTTQPPLTGEKVVSLNEIRQCK